MVQDVRTVRTNTMNTMTTKRNVFTAGLPTMGADVLTAQQKNISTAVVVTNVRGVVLLTMVTAAHIARIKSMRSNSNTIYFNHGKESGPWGAKIETLAEIARKKGFEVVSHDYTDQKNPDARVELLINLHYTQAELTVLVGSSMGAYVATMASALIKPVGLFLMAPAFHLPGYSEQEPVPHADKTVIVHGLQDEVVPVENALRFARKHSTELHLLDSDHRLTDQIPKIKILFELFLDDILKFSDAPHILTWEKLAADCELDAPWAKRVWNRLASEGLANFRNSHERNNVLLRFVALTDFYYSFLLQFCRERWGCEPSDTIEALGEPQALLDELLVDFIDRAKDTSLSKLTIKNALEEISLEHIYPALFKEFGEFEDIAFSIYRASYPTCDEYDAKQQLTAPEDLVDEYIEKTPCFRGISEWLRGKIAPERFGGLGISVTPAVGIFFIIEDTVLSDRVPLEKAGQYGDVQQHGEHYAYHENFDPFALVEWRFKFREYDYFPRGRVVCLPKQNTFILYADPCLTPEVIGQLTKLFGLDGQAVEVADDEQYHCVRCDKTPRISNDADTSN